MKFDVKINNLKIIYSQTAILSNSNDCLEIEVDTENQLKFKITIKFVDLNDNNDQNISSEVKNDEIQITCTNFKNPLGTGIKNPIDIATISGKKLYFTFWVYSLAGISKKIEYVFLLEE